MKQHKHSTMNDAYVVFHSLILSLFWISACTSPIISSPEASDSQQSLESTIVSMKQQITTLEKQTTQDAQEINIQTTQLAQQQSLLLTQQAAISPTNAQTSIGDTATLTPTQVTPSVAIKIPSKDDVDIQTKIQTAKILLFEDISGSKTRLPRYVKKALDIAGYSYTDVGSGQGWLKDQLESNTNWDLIIISSEVSGRISGDFFDRLSDYALNGTALILELGDLDAIYDGKSKDFLNRCGIEFEMDLPGSASGSIWFLQPDTTIISKPNELLPKLDYAKRQWLDSGDLVKIKKYGEKVVGDATLLFGTNKNYQDSHGVLTSCMDGRVLIQTFTNHQYDGDSMVKLWENYVYFTLYNHFLYQN